MSITTAQLGRALVAGALEEWRRPVLDIQPGRDADVDIITSYFTAVRHGSRSWQWYLDRTGGTYTERTLEGYQEWCGLFIAYVAQRRVGHHVAPHVCLPVRIDPRVAYYILPGTGRIASAAKWRAELDMPRAPQPDPADLQPGDVVTVGAGATGSHIILVATSPDGEGYFETLEGNADGELGDGTFGEGVVRRRWVQVPDVDGELEDVQPRHIDEVKQTARLTTDYWRGIN